MTTGTSGNFFSASSGFFAIPNISLKDLCTLMFFFFSSGSSFFGSSIPSSLAFASAMALSKASKSSSLIIFSTVGS
ncbi:hypothetical protein WICPIJ_007319 [Wickerhamomyces pijperi]|uniref:Uncharacterized protein n=1 Tax=Wickerhamomyces pijperi TaxID=599730 RepID=A0A9P8Q230_WICPI|nr:hypothetical protein WICPIJ_007319 [Wickerhamomyces pijperi]